LLTNYFHHNEHNTTPGSHTKSKVIMNLLKAKAVIQQGRQHIVFQ